MKVEDGIYIVPIYVGYHAQGPEALWEIWVEDHGVFSAHYIKGTLTFTPLLPPVVLDLLMGPINTMMRLMNPQYDQEDEMSHAVLTPYPTGWTYPEE